MSVRFGLLGVAALSAAMAIGCQSMNKGEHGNAKGEDDEKQVDLASTPAPVQTAIKRFAGNNKLEKITRENEHGKTVFEAEFDLDDMDHTITVSENGDVIEEEVEVKPASLPAAVTAAAKSKYPDGKIDEANTVKKDGKSFYEVIVVTGGAHHELQIGNDGTVMSDKVEKAKAEHDEKDEKPGHDKKD
jgi:uncharacterized membrane protein YkoI